jgi:hypothetical protein
MKRMLFCGRFARYLIAPFDKLKDSNARKRYFVSQVRGPDERDVTCESVLSTINLPAFFIAHVNRDSGYA